MTDTLLYNSEINRTFKKIGLYHFFLYFVIQTAILVSRYNIITISTHSILPVFNCKYTNSTHSTYSTSNSNEFICNSKQICDNNIKKSIVDDKSIKNWAYNFKLYCGKEQFFQFLTSSIFLTVIFASMVSPLISDKYGRLFSFKIQMILMILGFILILSEYNLNFIFAGVILSSIVNQLYSLSIIYLQEFFPQNIYSYLITVQNVLADGLGLLINYYAEYFKELHGLLFIFTLLIILIFIISVLFTNNTSIDTFFKSVINIIKIIGI